jgi:2-phospho-L-lactate guanylyltransferase
MSKRKGRNKVYTIVPFKPNNPKTRLRSYLNPHERERFAFCMLRDVLSALKGSEVSEILVIATENARVLRSMENKKISCTVCDGGLDEVLNSMFRTMNQSALIVMSDLPLITAPIINEIIKCKEDVVLVPGRKGGTNSIFLREPSEFRTDYYGLSFLKHLKIAEERGLSARVYDSFLASNDIDEPDDLLEVLIHGKGESAKYLKKIGIGIQIKDKLPVLVRARTTAPPVSRL